MTRKTKKPSLTLRPLTSIEKALLSRHGSRSSSPSPHPMSNLPANPSSSHSGLNFLERLLLCQNEERNPSRENAPNGTGPSPRGTPSKSVRSPRTSPPSSRGMSLPSSSSELREALLALQDLVEVIPPSTDPYVVSAVHEARMVLKRHRKVPERLPE